MTWPPEPTPYESMGHYIGRCAALISRDCRREEEHAALRATVRGLCCMCDEFMEDPLFECPHERRPSKIVHFYGREWDICAPCFSQFAVAFDLDLSYPEVRALIHGEWR